MTSELKGTLEPCGCTSDPLGDISRTAAVLKGAGRPSVYFDGGSTLYLEVPTPDDKREQAELTADALAQILPTLGLQAAGLGPNDGDKPRWPRQAANLPDTEPPKIVEVGGVKVGVFGVVNPALIKTAGDPAAAAREAIAGLRGKGAAVVVMLAGMNRADAKKLARDVPGADLVVVGHDLRDKGEASIEPIGDSHVIALIDRGQMVARVDLHLDGPGPFADALGPERAKIELARLDDRVGKLRADLERWQKDPDAEQAFVKKNRDELARLEKDQADLHARPMRAPERGSYLVVQPIAIKKGLPCDAEVIARKRALDEAIGAANLKSAQKPVPPEPGKPGFAGIEECGFCHAKAVDFWKGTRHAGAWETLEKVGKQWNRDCIGCHVTGWNEPGGATLAHNEPLRDVQCEDCHGPASIHVDKDGKDKPRTVTRLPAAELCAGRCHTPEHSDTFELEAYLRDVTGPGHGEALRKKLGDGPTGHALRSAALERAGKDLGAGCTK